MSLKRKIIRLNKVIKYWKQLKGAMSLYIDFLELQDKSMWGSITEEDEEGIKRAVQASNSKGPIIEIGAQFCHTTNLIASLKHNDVPLIAIENFTWNSFNLPPDVHRQFTRRTLRYVLDHCSTQIFDGDAADFYSANATLRPSMVFIDAQHDYKSVKQDIDWAVSVGCPVIYLVTTIMICVLV